MNVMKFLCIMIHSMNVERVLDDEKLYCSKNILKINNIIIPLKIYTSQNLLSNIIWFRRMFTITNSFALPIMERIIINISTKWTTKFVVAHTYYILDDIFSITQVSRYYVTWSLKWLDIYIPNVSKAHISMHILPYRTHIHIALQCAHTCDI